MLTKSEAAALRLEITKTLSSLLFITAATMENLISDEEAQRQGELVGEGLNDFIEELTQNETH